MKRAVRKMVEHGCEEVRSILEIMISKGRGSAYQIVVKMFMIVVNRNLGKLLMHCNNALQS